MSRIFARFVFAAYRTLGRLAGPAAALLLARRTRRGKEIAERANERWARGLPARPAGDLIWVHAASVGESLAVLPLVERLNQERPDLPLLMTSTTVTSAKLLAKRLPEAVIHQFSPLDLPATVERFLDHWRPDLAIYVESELWPGQLLELDRRAIPRVLVNGRMSKRSYRRWRRWPGMAGALLNGFAVVTAESRRSAQRLSKLGAPKVVATGNLKQAAAPLPADQSELEKLQALIGTRPRWLAASTHAGEERLIFQAHLKMAQHLPGLLTLLVPRHPERGAEIAEIAAEGGLTLARRSLGQEPIGDRSIYLADTLGELGLFYRLAPLVFVGGSLVPIGGHNPLEPARLSAALMAGPHMQNVAEATRRLEEARALKRISDADGLATAALALLSDPPAMAAAGEAAAAVGRAEAEVLDRSWAEIQPLLPPSLNRLPPKAS